MRLSHSLIAAASIIAITQVAFAAEQKGQGCDLRGVKGSGCEPPGGLTGKGNMRPTAEKSGPTKGGPGPTFPPPPPPQKQQ
jgi:hypothetical protein